MLRMPVKGKRIAIDIDEVLFPMIEPLTKYYNTKPIAKKRPKLINSKPKKYNYAQFFGINEEEAKYLVHGYYNSNNAYEVKPIEGSEKAMMELSKDNELYIVTGRQTYVQTKLYTEYMMNKYFPGIFEDILYTNSYSLNDEGSKEKHEIIKELNGNILVDDIIETCRICQLHDINAIVFGEYEWNEYMNWPRINNWDDEYKKYMY